MSRKLHTQVISANDVGADLINQMYDLYACYYDATHPGVFQRDLGQKSYVLLLSDDNDKLRGFTTLAQSTTTFSGRSAEVIFSGDTIIHHDFWGEQALPLAWCRLAGQIKAQSPQSPLFWFLIVKGHRTYRYLNIFSKRYYPHRKHATPTATQQLMDSLATERFGHHYIAEHGTVEYPQSQGHLKPEWANERIKKSPEADFFYRKNPHAQRGYELVCLTELATDNLRSFALRGFRQGMQDGRVVLG